MGMYKPEPNGNPCARQPYKPLKSLLFAHATSLGKGEVVSSILPSSTIFFNGLGPIPQARKRHLGTVVGMLPFSPAIQRVDGGAEIVRCVVTVFLLCDAAVSMSEEPGNDREWHARLSHPRRGRMPQRVRRHVI